MKTKLFFVWLLIIYNQANAQQSSQAFLESYGATGTQELFYKTSVIRGSDGYTYLSGATLNSDGNYDMLLSKMNSHNQVIWTQQYAGSAGGDDFAADLIQDGAGNIIITGTQYVSATNYNAVTIKYNSAGVQQWIQTFNGAANSYDGGIALARDASNNIYVCGGSYGITTLGDFLCIKYNSSGAQQWATTWNSVGLQDVSARIAVSGTQVSVIGASQQSTIDWKMASTFFNVNTGAFMGAKLTGGDDEGIDKVADLAIDANDNTYIVGSVRNINHEYDLKVIKLSSSYTTLWQQTYNGAANLNDEGLSLELTASNDVIVCGSTENATEGKNFLTLRYSGTTGGLMWAKIYDAQGGEDIATDLKLDASDNPIICGSSYKDGNIDYVVQKMKNTSGAIYWTGRWNSDFNLNDKPMNLVIDEDNNTVYVAGQSEVVENGYKYVVTKWSQKDVFMPKPVDGFSSSGGYIQNREQLRNIDGSANTLVKFYNQDHRVSTYIDDSKISYMLSQSLDSTNQDTTYRVDMSFTKGNTSAKVYPYGERKEYHNYYLGHMSMPSARTSVFNSVIKNNAYTNTDVVYTNSPSGFRHWIVARTGAPTADFEMTFSGQSAISVDGSGKLVVSTTIGNIIYTKAKAYTLNNSTGSLTLLTWQPNYSVSGNSVSFSSFGTWSGTLVLEFGEIVSTNAFVVLENVDWSTMFGANGNDQFKDVACNDTNDAFAFGETSSLTIIDNIGEYISAIILDVDVILVKFNSECEASFITYYGGSGYDATRGGEIDTHDAELYCVGTTSSSNLDNGVTIMEDNSYGGLNDGFYAKFSEFGQLLFHTYVGGTGADVCTAVSYDYFAPMNLNLIYYVGYTNSGTGWPALVEQASSSSMAYSGGRDGFIIKRSLPNEDVVWSTFFGSNQDDWITDVDLMRGSPVIVGITEQNIYSSQDGVLPSDGKFPKAHGSNWHNEWFDNGGIANHNYFAAYFGDNGQVLNQFFDQFRWSTYLCPTEDGIYYHAKASVFVDSDGFGFEDVGDAFFTGLVKLPNNGNLTFPFLQNGWHQGTPGGGDSDAFLMKFRMPGQTFSLNRSTLYGGDGAERGSGFGIDPHDNIYMCGQARVYSVQQPQAWCNPPTNGDFPMCDLNGLLYTETNIIGQNQRAFACAFTSTGEMRWSTEYGNGDINAGNAMAANAEKVWMVGFSNKHWTDVEYAPGPIITDYHRMVDPEAGEGQEATIARFDIPLILGVDETTNTNESIPLLYPNPSQSNITLNLESLNVSGTFDITIYNSMGQIVMRRLNILGLIQEINISNLAEGAYRIQINSNNSVSTVAFVKQ